MADPKNDTAFSAYLEAHANDAQLLLEVLCRQPSVVAQNLGMPEMADLIATLLGEIGFHPIAAIEASRDRLAPATIRVIPPQARLGSPPSALCVPSG